MKIRTLIAVALTAGLGLSAQAQSVVGSSHDLSSTGPGAKSNTTQVCVFCHTPHQTGTSVDPLWNHTMSATASYGIYASSTLDATPTDIGAGTAVSNLCMSCHDGTVSVASLYNKPGNTTVDPTLTAGGNVSALGIMSGSPLVGTDLSNDHPVNFTYNAALATTDGGLVSPASASSVDGTVPLFTGTVQCASCHDPHNNSNGSFLVATNAGSALCLRCHTK